MKFLKAAFLMVTVLFIGVIIIFVFNIQREQKTIRGKSGGVLLQLIASENADDQNLYFKISDTLAFQVGRDYLTGESSAVAAVVSYRKEAVPFCWVCGANQLTGGILQSPSKEGDYVYEMDVAYDEATMLSTDTTFVVLDMNTFEVNTVSKEEATQSLGLSISDNNKISVDEVANNYEALSFSKELCFVVITAFLIVYFFLFIWWGALKVFFRKQG